MVVRVWQPKFTVSAAAVIRDRSGKVLLLNHVLRPFSGWGLPGGFIEHEETPESAIRRELIEETGIELSNLELLKVRIVGTHVEILFAASSEDEGSVLSHEIIELGWFAKDGLPKGLSPSQKRLIGEVFSSDV